MTDKFDLALAILQILHKSISKPTKRKSFSKSDKKIILARQKNRCNGCGKKARHWDFDHVDGNSSNNSLDNGQALCPNCHADKSRSSKQKNLNLNLALKYLRKCFRR